MDFVGWIVRRQAEVFATRPSNNETRLEAALMSLDRHQIPEPESVIRHKPVAVERALSALSERDREILVRVYLKEQTPEQICREMALSETQFRLLKSRARAKFLEVSKTKRSKQTYFPDLAKATGESLIASHGPAEPVMNLNVSSLIEDPVVQILMSAAAAFQKAETGRSWLLTPSPSLGNVTPLSLIGTPAGREIVANELGLIEHGMF